MPTQIGTPVSSYQNGISSITFSATVPATGSRRAIVVQVGAFNGAGSITGVTYGGVALTKIGSTFGSIGVQGIAEQWVLVAPATGANDVVVTASQTLAELFAVATAYNDVDQAGPAINSTGGTGSSSAPSVAPTVAGSNMGTAFVLFFSGGATAATESDTLNAERDASGSETGFSSQYGDGSLSWTLSASSDWAACGCALVHDGGGAAGSPWYAYAQQ